jgi:hypothetical protein
MNTLRLVVDNTREGAIKRLVARGKKIVSGEIEPVKSGSSYISDMVSKLRRPTSKPTFSSQREKDAFFTLMDKS